MNKEEIKSKIIENIFNGVLNSRKIKKVNLDREEVDDENILNLTESDKIKLTIIIPKEKLNPKPEDMIFLFSTDEKNETVQIDPEDVSLETLFEIQYQVEK